MKQLNYLKVYIASIIVLSSNLFAYQASDNNDANDNGNEKNVAIGKNAYAKTNSNAYGSTAIGNDANATGNNALAIGSQSEASVLQATAIGPNAKALNQGAVAIGGNTTASGVGAMAFGATAESTARGSIALGNGSMQPLH